MNETYVTLMVQIPSGIEAIVRVTCPHIKVWEGEVSITSAKSVTVTPVRNQDYAYNGDEGKWA